MTRPLAEALEHGVGRVPFAVRVGRVAEKFGLLPSEALKRATMYDWQVLQLLNQVDEHQIAKADDGG